MNFRRLSVTTVAALTALFAIYVMVSRVPWDGTKEPGWYFGNTRGAEVQRVPAVTLMIARARLDHVVFPVPGAARILGPVDVVESGDAIYIVFFEALEGHRFVIYCGSRSTHRLLWKAFDSNPA
jgi:hypothetical protein